MPDSLPDRLVQLLRWTFLAVLLASLAFYVKTSIHWPILRDTSVMHYVIFLMDHGMKPYSEITDNNMPGAYLTERWAMEIFGRGDLAWRLYDLSLLAAITGAMVVIARPYDWLAGLFGGGIFALLHGSEGPDFPVEREEVLTAMLAVSLAFLFTALRKKSPLLMLGFGLLAGMAMSIKPTVAPLGLVLLVAAALVLRKQGTASAAYLWSGLAGMVVAGAIVLAFLLRNHALGPFLFVLRRITPAYVSMHNASLGLLLQAMIPKNLLLATILAIVLAVGLRGWTWERWIVFLAVLFGAVSYIAQRKGTIYHRYPFVAFLLLLLGLEFTTALRRRGWPRALAVAGILSILLISVPHYLSALRRSPSTSVLPFETALQADLADLGRRTDLGGRVECFDLTYGCFSALYHLGLVQNTGFTGDLLLFAPVDSYPATYYRDRFWPLLTANPPDVLVVSNEWFPYGVTFEKLSAWPKFSAYLAANYTQILARNFPQPGQSPPSDENSIGVPAYRIYVKHGNPALGNP